MRGRSDTGSEAAAVAVVLLVAVVLVMEALAIDEVCYTQH